MPTLIDPQQIYPKKMGTYKGALVVQYYNLERDCFKKHVIPYDHNESLDKIVQNMLKNPKHSHIKQAISGSRINILPSDINENYDGYNTSNSNQPTSQYNSHSSSSNQQNRNKPSNTNSYSQPSNNTSSNQRQSSHTSTSYIPSGIYSHTPPSQESHSSQQNQSSSNLSDKWNAFKKKDADQSGSYNLSTSKLSKKSDRHKPQASSHNFQQSYEMNFDEQSISVVPIRQPKKNEHKIEQQIDYYEQDFQELSQEKIQIQNKNKIQKQKEKDKEKEKDKQKLKKKKQKKQKIDEFEFLDDQQPKKKKKKKKQKSKQKQKSSKQNSSSYASKQISKQTSVKDEVPIQQQFDFI